MLFIALNEAFAAVSMYVSCFEGSPMASGTPSGLQTYPFQAENNDKAQSSTEVIIWLFFCIMLADHGARKLLTSTSFLTVVTGYGKRLYEALVGSRR